MKIADSSVSLSSSHYYYEKDVQEESLKGLERNNLDFPFPNCITPLAGLTSPKSSP
ncbi:MAG: hypothetical protein U9O82_08055 [Thermodesulfobacteriota bacterium]|nr:hypothetical protein [Thermodesulfobacteriota bacterium]